MTTAPRFWYRPRGLLSYLLSLFSYLYQMIVWTRRCFYRLGLKKISCFKVPIIIVGNITVGGTGKTPLVIWICNQFIEKGYRVGVVSRGYGGAIGKKIINVKVGADPAVVGEEAILIQKNTNCPMVVGVNRSKAVKELLQSYYCDIVISDDGLQHYALSRDCEIVVVDAKRGFGNHFCLPAGPLREPVSRLKSYDFVIENGDTIAENKICMIPRRLINITNSDDILELKEITGKTVHAVAGIGNPERFFSALKKYDPKLIKHIFPDHYHYSSSDFKFANEGIIVMTEKDMIKCTDFATENMYYLDSQLKVSEDFFNKIVDHLRNKSLI